MSSETSRTLLANTYYAFLAKFRHLSPIQSKAIEPIVDGNDVLLIAATATGKTQAYSAPLTERYFARLKKGTGSILIVSPTRALVNDLFRRLKKPLEACGIPIQRKTGDHRLVPQEPLAGVCITTPESLDSWICRYPKALSTVCAIVLDELHVLAGTCRGSHLRLLLERLEAVVDALGGSRPQRVAASATIPHPMQLRAEFLGPDAEIVADETRRVLEFASAPYEDAASLWRTMLEQFRGGRCKFLIFCATRREVEALAEALKYESGRPSLILVHHGALSKPTRLRNEASFLQADQGVLVATSSLELGLDIGDVDGVVLLGPPPDVSSFLQRAGRSGRRKGPSFLLGLHRSPGEQLQLEHLALAAGRGDLLGISPGFFASVLFQQAASLAFQNRNTFIAAGPWESRLPGALRERFPVSRLEGMLAHWAGEGFYVERANRFYPAQKLEQMHERGKTHSNIDDTQAGQREVIEAETGRSLGHVRVSKGQNGLQRGGQVVLGGQTRRFLSAGGDGPLRTTVGGSGAAEGQSKTLTYGSQSLSPSVSLPLARDFGKFLGMPDNSLVLLPGAGWSIVAHFYGTLWGELFGDFLRYTIGKLRRTLSLGNAPLEIKSDGYLLRCRLRLTEDILRSCQQKWLESPPEWDKLLVKRVGKLGRVSGSGPWFARLPAEDQWEDLSQRLDLATFSRTVGEAEIAPCPDVLKERLRHFLE